MTAQSPAPGTKLPPGAVLTVKVAAAPGAGQATGTAPGQNAVTQQVAACSAASASPPAQGSTAGKVAVPNVAGMSSAGAQQVMATGGG